MRSLLVGTLLLLASLPTTAPAAEYFVSTRGSDTAEGTSPATAFATIQHGVDALEPGDTLTIQPGDYLESVRREGLGSSEADTVIRAAIPGTVLLRGDVAAPAFRPVEGRRFVYVAPCDAPQGVQAVIELDTLTTLEPLPNATELEFMPGRFFHDQEAGKLYISTSDWQPPAEHRYAIAVTPTHGFYLGKPQRVTVEGIAVTGFHAIERQPNGDFTDGRTWGLILSEATDCVVRDCYAYLNECGIAINSRVQANKGYGGNTMAGCVAWGNSSEGGSASAGLAILGASRDVLRDSVSFLNAGIGVSFYHGGIESEKEQHKSRMINNLAWGNGTADVKIKTGYKAVHTVENMVAERSTTNPLEPTHSLFVVWRSGSELSPDNIALDQEENLDVEQEFADPANHDYRLQATSRFRGAAPDGSDRGPFPYEPNIYYISSAGDDSADGLSVRHAWKTFARAARDLQPGDTLYLLPGTTYQADAKLTLSGTAGEPIAIRGRGTEPVVLEGVLHLADSSHVTFQRLGFDNEVTISDGEAIAFENCRFSGAEVALQVTGTTGLDVRHCEFSDFGRAAIALNNSSNAYLSGNLYDNQDAPALQLDTAEALRYSDYNMYRQADTAWRVSGEVRGLDAIQQRHDAQAGDLDLAAVIDRADAGEPAASLVAQGPLGRPVGTYRDRKQENPFRLVQPPAVHSVSATTANLEWVTSRLAACEVAWGETPACDHRDTLVAPHFASYSLTGLKPGTTYYFRVTALKEPLSTIEAIGYERTGGDRPAVALATEPLSFTTLEQDAPPQTYYVATDGDDTNTGLSRGQAWRTIAHAAARVNVGDTVRIAGGTYPERVRIRATGTADAPITFAAIPGEKVVLDGVGQLSQAFVAAKKSHLRFDSLYFDRYSDQSGGALILRSSLFNLYGGRDIHITRCFADCRGQYPVHFVVVWEVSDLLVKNCVTTNNMGSGIDLWRCPDVRIENYVSARPLIASLVVNNTSDQKVTIANSIFTDMLAKKAKLNIAFFQVETIDTFDLENNAFFLREFPPAERIIFSDVDHATRTVTKEWTIPELESQRLATGTLAADPRFGGDDSPPDIHGLDRMMHPGPLDFNDFFATNPELVARGIGLQPEAFEGFHFHRQAVASE